MVSCYLRVIQVVLTNPGYVPLDEKTQHRRHSSRHVRRRGIDEYGRSQKEGEAPDKGYLDRAAVLDGRVPPPPGLQNFYSRDVFECDIDGLPRWCASCQIWKPDRSHHSSEIARCVYKMDHHCPWFVVRASHTILLNLIISTGLLALFLRQISNFSFNSVFTQQSSACS